MPKKKPGFFKRWSAKLHLWLGLFIGALIFIISITGALYVFKDEVVNFTRKQYIYHNEGNVEHKKVLPIRVLETMVNDQTKEKFPIHWVTVPINPSMSYQFNWYEHSPDQWNYFDEFPIYKVAYVNPYNGEVLQIYDEKNGFFNIVKYIHWSYLLNSSWGSYVVGIPVVIFLIMLITGIVLWWPKNKAARKQRFRFQWKQTTQWKRKNYDLHNILGFYSSIFALILAITGLFYSFLVVKVMIYFVFSGGNIERPHFSNIKTKAPIEMRNEETIDIISNKVKKLYPEAYTFILDLGHEHLDDHQHPNFSVFVRHLNYSFHKNSNLIFDENSGKLLHVRDPKDKNFGEKTLAANYDMHVGSILGLPTKIIAFFVSIIIASMPITGFMIWWGRKKKKAIKQVTFKSL